MKIEINIDDRLIESLRTFFSRKNIIIICAVVFVMSIVTIKAAVTLKVFEANTPIKSSEINENFATLQAQIDANTAQIAANTTLININTPSGTILAYAGATVPDGWLECNGAAVSRSDYAALFAAIGTSWGSGNGTTTFRLPDLRGRFLRGVDHGAGNDPDSAARTALLSGGNTGDNVGSYQLDQFGSHFHDYTTRYSYTDALNDFDSDGDDHGYTLDVGRNTGFTGGNETRPKNAYVYYIIKAN